MLSFRIGGDKCFFSCLYRSPSQGWEKFESFCTDFDLFLSNINDLSQVCSIITGDFNARSTKWWKIDKEELEGQEINIITRTAGYSQLINQPKHITKDSLSCIDLIFISNPNLINSSSVEMSLFEKYHHNTNARNYKNASAESILHSISSIHWDFLFKGKSIKKGWHIKWVINW